MRTRNYVHHLVSRTGGRSNHRLILRSLLAQVLERNRVELAIPDGIPDLTKAFEEALEQRASKGEPVVVILDSLEQLIADADSPIPFLVTDALPDGVYFLVTTRPDDWIRSKPYSLYSVDQATMELTPLQSKQCEELLRMCEAGSRSDRHRSYRSGLPGQSSLPPCRTGGTEDEPRL